MAEEEERDLKHYLNTTNYVRVIKLAKTPDWDEFSSSALRVVTAVCLVGFIGYLIFVLMSFIPF